MKFKVYEHQRQWECKNGDVKIRRQYVIRSIASGVQLGLGDLKQMDKSKMEFVFHGDIDQAEFKKRIGL